MTLKKDCILRHSRMWFSLNTRLSAQTFRINLVSGADQPCVSPKAFGYQKIHNSSKREVFEINPHDTTHPGMVMSGFTPYQFTNFSLPMCDFDTYGKLDKAFYAESLKDPVLSFSRHASQKQVSPIPAINFHTQRHGKWIWLRGILPKTIMDVEYWMLLPACRNFFWKVLIFWVS